MRSRRSIVFFTHFSLVLCLTFAGCGGGANSTPPTPPPPPPATPDFSVSIYPTSLQVARGSSGSVQASVKGLNGFTGSVTVTPKNLPTGITSASININAGSSGTLTLTVTSATAVGPFTISLTGTSGNLSHPASVALIVPLGGAVNTLVPRTSGQLAFPASSIPYLTQLIADIVPVRLAECGTASSAHTIEVVYNPGQGFNNFDETNLIINIYVLPAPDATGVDQFFDQGVMHESTHALQTDLLRIMNGVNLRGTIADVEGIAQACAYRMSRNLALSGKRAELRSAGDLDVLWLDTFLRGDAETISAGGWSTSAPHVQPMRTLGEAVFLLSATQKGANGKDGIIEHESALFAAETGATTPLTAAERIAIWDSLALNLDGQTPGAWMPAEMIKDPPFTVGKSHLIAWPVYGQFPAQMMAQAFTVTSVDQFNFPTVQPVTSGPLTITVKDASPQHNVVLGPIQADFFQTTGIANYSLNLQTNAPQGTYTVFVNATVNSTALQASFVVANIPFNQTGLGGTDLAFPGQYLIAIDNQGNANGGSLTVTRGTVVWSMPGFAIVKPDSTGTFDVTGPSGTQHTYTSPDPWARFIPVE